MMKFVIVMGGICGIGCVIVDVLIVDGYIVYFIYWLNLVLVDVLECVYDGVVFGFWVDGGDWDVV